MSNADQPRWWAFGRMLLLGLFDPAGMYFQRNSPNVRGPLARGGEMYRGGAMFGPGVPGGSRQASEVELREMRERSLALSNERREHAQDMRDRYGALVDAAARALAETGVGVIATPTARLDARVIRFWHGDSVLDIQWHSATGSIGSSTTRLERRRVSDIPLLAGYLARSLPDLAPR
jgi:hypothetical protein